MNNLLIRGFTGALLVMLVGCGDNGSVPGSDTVVDPIANGVEAIFAADRDGDPVIISDDTALGTDIDSLFGDESAEPVSLNQADTIGDVLDQVGNG